MSPQRRAAILEAMARGASYSAANRYTQNVFDTVSWGEITSRLHRARGSVLWTAVRIAQQRDACPEPSEFREETSAIQDLAGQAISQMVQQVPVDPAQPTKRKRHQQEQVAPAFDVSVGRMQGSLRQARKFLAKICRDVPHLPENIGVSPTVPQLATINLELARIKDGAMIVQDLVDHPLVCNKDPRPRNTRQDDPLGIGSPYAAFLGAWIASRQIDRRIATHHAPDADALVAVWMAERFLFFDESCAVTFVDRRFAPCRESGFDCVVDVGRSHDPARRHFDHKPPAVLDRHSTCATRLVWEHLRSLQRPVEHLAQLVDLIHAGDSARLRASSFAYQESRRSGLHAHIHAVRDLSETDAQAYRAIRYWLDGKFCK